MREMINPKRQVKRVIGLARRAHYKVKKKLSIAKNYDFSIDSPRKSGIEKRLLVVEGWIIPRDGKEYDIRIRNNAAIHSVRTKIKRLDVQKTHMDRGDLALYSGFSAEFEFEDGSLAIEISTGGPFKTL